MRYINKAFTLVELIVVITILSVLSTVAFVSLVGYGDDARDATKVSDLTNIGRSLGNASTAGIKFNIDKLQDITYSAYPINRTVQVGQVTPGIIPGLGDNPVDPFTGLPYVVGLHANSDGTVNFGQIGGILENRKGETTMLGSDTKIPANIPVQRVVGNYQINQLSGISGLIPRWAIQDFEGFKNTGFYSSGNVMYGAALRAGTENSYLFASDRIPVMQIAGYTNEDTLVYESFENVDVLNIGEVGNPDNYPRCLSYSISQEVAHEGNSRIGPGNPRIVNCSINRTQGQNSSSSLHLQWSEQGTGDGQYHYTSLDKTKQYQISMDVKGTMDTTLRINYVCYRVRQINQAQNMGFLGSAGMDVTLDPNNFTRISAYVNTPDPSGNGLSIDIQSDAVADSQYSCIFYRIGDPKAGEELFFDNFIVREIN